MSWLRTNLVPELRDPRSGGAAPMRVDYPTVSEPATPEYVLEVLRDQHRQQCEYDPAAESAELTLESTVA